MSIHIHPDLRLHLGRDLHAERIAQAQRAHRRAEALRALRSDGEHGRRPLLQRLRRLEAR